MNKYIVFSLALIATAALNSCSKPCSNCSANVCYDCNTGYYFLSNQCLACPSNCQSCSNSFTCLTCNSGYYLNTSSLCVSICLKNCGNSNANCCSSCSSGYYLNNKTCQKCINNCQDCKTNSSCSTCMTNYEYYSANATCLPTNCNPAICKSCDNTSLACILCYDGFVAANYKCKECASNCSSCSNNTCNCLSGTYSSNNYCYSCLANCSSCSNATNCNTCTDSFTLTYTNGVTSCQLKSSSSSMLLVVGIIIFSVVVVVFLACCIYRIRNGLSLRQVIVIDAAQSMVRIEPISYKWQSYQNKTNLKQLQCPICLETCPEVETTCRHLFHLRCVLEWSSSKKTCPFCRQQLKQIKLICFGCRNSYLSISAEQARHLMNSLCEECSNSRNL